MEKPTIHLYLRHYVRDAATLERYRDIVFRVMKAAQYPSLAISVVVGVHPQLSADHRYQMFLLSRNLLDRDIAVHHLQARGCGHAYLYVLGQTLSTATPRADVLCLLDADQFLFDEPRFYQQLEKLAFRLVKENKLMGLGIRDHISLGGGELGIFREIEEMFFALFVQRKILYATRKEAAISQSYKDLGDPIPGCYCFNLAHTKLPLFIMQCLRDARRANLWGYAGDPYLSMLASMFSRIITEIMPTHDNPPGLFTLQDIEKQHGAFGNTVLRKPYLACIKAERNVKRIQKYYPAEQVLAVQRMMLRGLEK
ncbi:hypothetical protein HY488_03650, partial [Candidatus Woesearchaeota archaeon]|nr:hypothetical protein [Candidatus Woesearchaeota archaeon]